MTFYNTTHEHGQKLALYKDKAANQEDRMLDFFRRHPGNMYTRPELHKLVLVGTPVSSITRCLADLKKKGLVQRLHAKREGEYGRPCHCWRLAGRRRPRRLLLRSNNGR